MNALKALSLAAALGGVAFAGVATVPAIAQQNGYYIYEITYYSDPGKTQQVGYEYQHCNRFADSFGQATPYKTERRIGFCQYGGGGGEY